MGTHTCRETSFCNYIQRERSEIKHGISLLLRVFLKNPKSAATEAEFVQNYILINKIVRYV
jgi:hypothetical protein